MNSETFVPDWARRQLIPQPQPRYLQPSLQQRITRLNPRERHDLQQLVRSLKLRKAIHAVLVASFHKTNDTASSK